MIPVGDGEAGLLSGAYADLLTDSATVYDDDPSTGAWTVAIKTGLDCRLAPVNFQLQAAGFDRPELAGMRTFQWSADYFLRNDVQVEVAGHVRTLPDGTNVTQRWIVQNNTQTPVRPPGGGDVLVWTCQVTEALT